MSCRCPGRRSRSCASSPSCRAARTSSAGAGRRRSPAGRSCKARLDARIAEQQGAPLAPWTVHDLRRTFATLAAEHGLIEPFHIEAILNHVSGHRNGVAGDLQPRRSIASRSGVGLQCWADWLEATVEGRAPAANVVALAG